MYGGLAMGRLVFITVFALFMLGEFVVVKDIYAKDAIEALGESLASSDSVVNKKSSRKVPTFFEALKRAMDGFENDNVCAFKRLSSEYFLIHEMNGMPLEDNLLTIEQVYLLLKMEKMPVDHTVVVDLKRLTRDVYRHGFATKLEQMGFLYDEYMSCLELEEY